MNRCINLLLLLFVDLGLNDIQPPTIVYNQIQNIRSQQLSILILDSNF